MSDTRGDVPRDPVDPEVEPIPADHVAAGAAIADSPTEAIAPAPEPIAPPVATEPTIAAPPEGPGHAAVPPARDAGPPSPRAYEPRPQAPAPAGAFQPPPPATPPTHRDKSPRWIPFAIIGAVLVGIVVVALVLFVFSSSDDGKDTAYKEQLSTAMRPVINANEKLSSALRALRGTNTTLAQRRARDAQEATLTARGAVQTLSVPSGSQQLATNARGTLGREDAYLAAVASALANPASASAAQSQTLASNLTDALNAIAPAKQDWARSVAGADTLTTWAPRAVATKARHAAAKRAAARRRAARRNQASGQRSGSSTAPPSLAGGTDCGGGLHAGPNTSCPFAQNVRDAYNEAPGAHATVRVFSPVTDQTYTMTCAPAGNGVTCSGGNNASATWSY